MIEELLTKCSVCGMQIYFPAGENIVACKYCDRINDRPKSEPEKRDSMKLANELRNMGEFAEARQRYLDVLAANAQEHEARWGLLLCKYGVVYVEDSSENKKERLITCRRSLTSSFRDEEFYQTVLEQASPKVRAAYEKDADYIDRIQGEIRLLREQVEPYDVFLCYKETAPEGGRTEDSEIAHRIYNELSRSDYRVFYAPESLKERSGANYEAAIFLAIESSRVMLALGTKKEYFEATWVRSEWRRFLERIDQGETKLLLPLFRDASDLPDAFKKRFIQGYKMEGPYLLDVESRLNNTLRKDDAKGSYVIDLLKQEDFKKADPLLDQMLLNEPKNAKLWMLKAMTGLRVREEEDLCRVEKPLTENKDFAQALEYAKEPLKSRLRNIAERAKKGLVVPENESERHITELIMKEIPPESVPVISRELAILYARRVLAETKIDDLWKILWGGQEKEQKAKLKKAIVQICWNDIVTDDQPEAIGQSRPSYQPAVVKTLFGAAAAVAGMVVTGVSRSEATGSATALKIYEAGKDVAENFAHTVPIKDPNKWDQLSLITYWAVHEVREAKNRIWELYAMGFLNDTEKPFNKAANTYLEESAAGENPTAQYHLGQIHERGMGCPRDMGKAVEWYVRAAKNGCALAFTALESLGREITAEIRSNSQYAQGRSLLNRARNMQDCVNANKLLTTSKYQKDYFQQMDQCSKASAFFSRLAEINDQALKFGKLDDKTGKELENMEFLCSCARLQFKLEMTDQENKTDIYVLFNQKNGQKVLMKLFTPSQEYILPMDPGFRCIEVDMVAADAKNPMSPDEHEIIGKGEIPLYVPRKGLTKCTILVKPDMNSVTSYY